MVKVTAGREALDAAHAEHMQPMNRTILLVEDEEMVRALISEALLRQGYQVLTCCDAAEGIENCKLHGTEIDLLLTDVVMPGMSGPEMADQIHKMRPQLRVVFMSGYTEHVLKPELVSGSFYYLQKPFTLKTLTQTVAKVLDNMESAG